MPTATPCSVSPRVERGNRWRGRLKKKKVIQRKRLWIVLIDRYRRDWLGGSRPTVAIRRIVKAAPRKKDSQETKYLDFPKIHQDFEL